MAGLTDLTLDISNLEQLDHLAKGKLPRMVYDYYRYTYMCPNMQASKPNQIRAGGIYRFRKCWLA